MHACAQSCLTLQPHGLYPLSMGLSRQEYLSGFPFPPPEYLSNAGTATLSCPRVSCVSCAADRFFTSWAAGEAPYLEQTASWTQNIKNGMLTTGDAASGIICQKKQEKKTPWVLTNHSIKSDSSSVHLLIKMPGYNLDVLIFGSPGPLHISKASRKCLSQKTECKTECTHVCVHIWTH